jgi:hypothetical protein
MTTNAKAFKKGDLVTYIADWDRKGSTYFRHAVVYACGKKQMVLTDAETGEEMGRHFRPVRAEGLGEVGIFARLSDADATAHALALAQVIIDRETKNYEHCLTLGHGEGYNASIRKGLAAIHAPDAAPYSARTAHLREKLGVA